MSELLPSELYEIRIAAGETAEVRGKSGNHGVCGRRILIPQRKYSLFTISYSRNGGSRQEVVGIRAVAEVVTAGGVTTVEVLHREVWQSGA